MELTDKMIKGYGFETTTFEDVGIEFERYTLPNGIVLDRMMKIDGKPVTEISLDGFNDELCITTKSELDYVLTKTLEEARAIFVSDDDWHTLYPE